MKQFLQDLPFWRLTSPCIQRWFTKTAILLFCVDQDLHVSHITQHKIHEYININKHIRIITMRTNPNHIDFFFVVVVVLDIVVVVVIVVDAYTCRIVVCWKFVAAVAVFVVTTPTQTTTQHNHSTTSKLLLGWTWKWLCKPLHPPHPTHHKNSTLVFRSLRLTFIDQQQQSGP